MKVRKAITEFLFLEGALKQCEVELDDVSTVTVTRIDCDSLRAEPYQLEHVPTGMFDTGASSERLSFIIVMKDGSYRLVDEAIGRRQYSPENDDEFGIDTPGDDEWSTWYQIHFTRTIGTKAHGERVVDQIDDLNKVSAIVEVRGGEVAEEAEEGKVHVVVHKENPKFIGKLFGRVKTQERPRRRYYHACIVDRSGGRVSA